MARFPVTILRRRRARHTAQSFFLGTSCGHAFLLAMIMTILITACAGVWVALGPCWPDDPADPCLELADPTSYLQSMWLAWGIFFDPGTQTGLPPTSPVPHKFVLLLFTVCGFIFNLVVLGLVVNNLVTVLTRWLRIHHVVVANQHTVILGWTDRTLFLMAELAGWMSSSHCRGGTLVVMGDLPSLQMTDEVNITYPDWYTRFPGVRLVLRQGKPYELSDIDKVSLHAAQQVVVMGTGRSPSLADSLTITTLSALRCLPKSHQLSSTTPVVLEMQLLQNVSAARQIAGGAGAASHVNLVPVCAARAVDYLAVLCATAPPTGRALVELISSQGMEFHTFQMASRFVGQTIRQIGHDIPVALIVGIVHTKEGSRSATERELSLVPPDDTVLGPSDQLVLLAENEHEVARLVGCKVTYSSALDWDRMLEHLLSEQGPELVMHQAKVHMETLATETRHIINESRDAIRRVTVNINDRVAGRAKGQSPQPDSPSSRASSRASRRQSMMNEASVVTDDFKAAMHARMQADTASAAARGRVVLIVGWKRGFGRMLRAFDMALPAGSHIYVVSAKTEEWRKTDLAGEGLDVNGASLETKRMERRKTGLPESPENGASVEMEAEKSPKKFDPHSNSAEERVEARRRRQVQYDGLKNVKLHHHYGDPTDAAALRMLPLDAADIAYVLADETAEEDKAFHLDDAEAMTSTVLLRRLRAGLSASARKRGLPPAPPLTLVTQCVDVLTHRLLKLQPDLLDGTGGAGSGGATAHGGAREGALENLEGITPLADPSRYQSQDTKAGSNEGGTQGPDLTCESLMEPSLTVGSTRQTTTTFALAEPTLADASRGTEQRRGTSAEKRRRLSRQSSAFVNVDTQNGIESVVLHRNWLETAALSTAAIGGASWSIVRLLLDPMSPTRVYSIRAACIIADNELAEPFRAGIPYSFWELRARLMALECGLLIGWRRGPHTEAAGPLYGAARTPDAWTQRVNPAGKDTQLQWNGDDELLVIHFAQRHVNVFQGPAALAAEAARMNSRFAEEEHKAAETIQRMYRGFMSRCTAKELLLYRKDAKSPPSSPRNASTSKMSLLSMNRV